MRRRGEPASIWPYGLAMASSREQPDRGNDDSRATAILRNLAAVIGGEDEDDEEPAADDAEAGRQASRPSSRTSSPWAEPTEIAICSSGGAAGSGPTRTS